MSHLNKPCVKHVLHKPYNIKSIIQSLIHSIDHSLKQLSNQSMNVNHFGKSPISVKPNICISPFRKTLNFGAACKPLEPKWIREDFDSSSSYWKYFLSCLKIQYLENDLGECFPMEKSLARQPRQPHGTDK